MNWLKKSLHTRVRIDGTVFLIALLMLFPSPTTLGLLPLLILKAPMRFAWKKTESRVLWRVGSSLWLCISLIAGVMASLWLHGEAPQRIGWPMGYEVSPGYYGPWPIAGLFHGLNVCLIAGTLMLPISALSYIETKKRLKQ
ncbi:hypothetical protein [Cerasicoccus fimbriatus]|uniref:hypothetical protein n=1 Tax=Cerasicoccus fimbriatus TaxID=3014554 RepID=UPI0022B3D61F|nr:hypothetical protein [Cerasicoccus sp. TK19100]